MAIATAAMCLPALYNGQPFIFPDTAGYARSVDFAVTKLFSPELATEWSRGAAYGATPAAGDAATPAAGDAPDAPSNAVDAPAQERNLWRGRSVYYGVLAYLGYVLGGFWPTIVVHGLLLAFTGYTFVRHAFELTPEQSGGVLAATAVLTPAGAYVSYVTPDVLGGVGLVAAATLLAFHHRLSAAELIALAVVVAVSAATHTATLALLLLVTVLGVIVSLTRGRAEPLGRRAMGVAVMIGALSLAGLADAASSFAVKTLMGRTPLTLPIPMAQLVEDGPGARLMRERCDELDFAVCAFTHALPVEDSNDFLFNPNEDAGILQVADPETQRAIVAEQRRFLIATLTNYPLDTFRAAFDNWWTQMNMFEINEFNYVPVQIDFFDNEQLPDRLYARMIATPAYNGDVPIMAASIVFTAVFWPSFIALTAALALTAGRRLTALRSLDIALLVIIAGVMMNAAVCGILAGPYDRYGGRVAWAIPLIAFAGAVALWRDGWGARVRSALGLGAAAPATATEPGL